MPHAHTVLSRLTTVATALLAVALVVAAGRDSRDPSYVVVPLVVLAFAALAAAAKLARDNCFESRLLACSTALATISGVLLAYTVGLPGIGEREPAAVGLTMIAISGVVLLLVGLDQVRRGVPTTPAPPYAL